MKKAYLVNTEDSLPVIIHAESRNIARYQHWEKLSFYFDHDYIKIKAVRKPEMDTQPATWANISTASGYKFEGESDDEFSLMICGCEICLDKLRRM